MPMTPTMSMSGLPPTSSLLTIINSFSREDDFWLGFDIATGIFGDPALNALGRKSMGTGSEKIRSTSSDGEHVLLPTDEVGKGFDASVAFHLGRKRG